MDIFDFAIIGAGPAGEAAAFKARVVSCANSAGNMKLAPFLSSTTMRFVRRS